VAAPAALPKPQAAAKGKAAPSVPAPTPAPAPARKSYLEVSLSQYSSRTFANGLVLAVKRQPGRAAAAARIALVPGPYPERLAGLPALALACAAKGPAGSPRGRIEAELYRAGASLELRVDDFDDVALELSCPLESLVPLLELVGKSLVAPAFRREDFESSLGAFRLAERRDSGDPALRAAALLRAAAYAGHPYALPPRGTAASLASIGRDELLRFWAEGAGAERLRVSVVGDLDPAELASRLEPTFGSIPRRGPAPPKPAPLPLRGLVVAEAFPSLGGRAWVRAEIGAPPSSSPDFAALAVALAMLDDLVSLRLRSGAGGAPIAYSAWTRLSSAGAGSASLVVQDCVDPLAAKAAFEGAAAELAAGLCLDAAGAASGAGSLGGIDASLGAYRLRAVSRAYARSGGSSDIAARIARDLAAGGDGTAFFRMADRIAAVGGADVARVAREYLVEGRSAWIALGDPKLVAAFAK